MFLDLKYQFSFFSDRNHDRNQGTTVLPYLGDLALAQRAERRVGSNSTVDGQPLSQAQRHALSTGRTGLTQYAAPIATGKQGLNHSAS